MTGVEKAMNLTLTIISCFVLKAEVTSAELREGS